MRNRAKCNLCDSIIESHYKDDFVTCKCGEIAIWGGLYELGTQAKDYANFLRVDDQGHEIVVKYNERSPDKAPNDIPEEPPKEVTKKELLDILDGMIKADENLPERALHSPLSYYDLLRYMLVISNILKKDGKRPKKGQNGH